MEASKLQLFLTFIMADKRGLPEFTEKLKRKIPGSKLDFPLFRYIFSLKNRVGMLTILREDIHKLNKKAIEEIERTQEKGSGTNEKGLTLTAYYESFLNQIYNIMENVAKINLFMFDANKDPPHDFSSQMKQIKKGNLTFHSEYDMLLKEKMDWYEEVHRIRSNSNHYLVGTNVFGRAENGEWIPQYMNFNISDRFPNKDLKIERNILRDTDFFYDSIIKILNKISEVYIERMDKEKPCAVTFVGKDEIEFRELSFTEYMSGQKGKLIQSPIRRK